MESERRLPGAAQYPRPEGISGKCYSPRNLQRVKRWRTPSPRNSATGSDVYGNRLHSECKACR
jgi:hypothetical protein